MRNIEDREKKKNKNENEKIGENNSPLMSLPVDLLNGD